MDINLTMTSQGNRISTGKFGAVTVVEATPEVTTRRTDHADAGAGQSKSYSTGQTRAAAIAEAVSGAQPKTRGTNNDDARMSRSNSYSTWQIRAVTSAEADPSQTRPHFHRRRDMAHHDSRGSTGQIRAVSRGLRHQHNSVTCASPRLQSFATPLRNKTTATRTLGSVWTPKSRRGRDQSWKDFAT